MDGYPPFNEPDNQIDQNNFDSDEGPGPAQGRPCEVKMPESRWLARLHLRDRGDGPFVAELRESRGRLEWHAANGDDGDWRMDMVRRASSPPMYRYSVAEGEPPAAMAQAAAKLLGGRVELPERKQEEDEGGEKIY
jgi:hypothetical protein